MDIPAAADLGTHSAHCARPWTFTGTVLAGCDVVLWLVAQKTVESPQLQWLWRRPVLGQGRCARWCNDWECAMLGSTVDTFSASVYGGLYGRFLIYST